MLTRKQGLIIFSVIVFLGTMLGIIGTISFPIKTNMSYFWPAAVIQAISGLFFGKWGVMAATIFPSISNALTDGSWVHIIGLIPANFLQSFLPLIVKRSTHFSIFTLNKRTIFWFLFGCVIIPNFLGGILGCGILYFSQVIVNSEIYFITLKAWLVGNISCSAIFGLLLMKTLSPALKDSELLQE